MSSTAVAPIATWTPSWFAAMPTRKPPNGTRLNSSMNTLITRPRYSGAVYDWIKTLASDIRPDWPMPIATTITAVSQNQLEAENAKLKKLLARKPPWEK